MCEYVQEYVSAGVCEYTSGISNLKKNRFQLPISFPQAILIQSFIFSFKLTMNTRDFLGQIPSFACAVTKCVWFSEMTEINCTYIRLTFKLMYFI